MNQYDKHLPGGANNLFITTTIVQNFSDNFNTIVYISNGIAGKTCKAIQ